MACARCFKTGGFRFLTCCVRGNKGNLSRTLANLVFLIPFFLTIVMCIVIRFYLKSIMSEWTYLSAFCTEATEEAQNLCTGIYGVHRLSFALFLFHVVLAGLCFFIKSMHKSCWIVKIAMYILLTVGCFFIPNLFYTGYIWFARFGGAVFIILQVIIMVDFGCDVHEFLLSKGEALENDRFGDDGDVPCCAFIANFWLMLYLGLTGICYLAGILGTIALYILFTAPNGVACWFNIAVITETALVAIVYSVLSASRLANRGVLTPSIMFCYCVYVAFSSMKSSPDKECNPYYNVAGEAGDSWLVVVGLLASSIALAWICFRAATGAWGVLSLNAEEIKTNVADNTVLNKVLAGEDEDEDTEGGNSGMGGDEEAGSDKESFAQNMKGRIQLFLFHVVMAIGALYMSMVITNWGSTTGTIATFGVNSESQWIKIAGQWATYVLYFWILIAPIIFSGRDFSDN